MKCPKCQYDDISTGATDCPQCGAKISQGAKPSTVIEVDQKVEKVEGGRVAGVDIGQVTGNTIVDQRQYHIHISNQGTPAGTAQAKVDSRNSLLPANDIDPRKLREVMIKNFDMEDLDLLCNDVQLALRDNNIELQLNLEIVGGSGKAIKVLNLIQYLDRRGHLDYLVSTVRNARPGII
jgi:hypothetical protein